MLYHFPLLTTLFSATVVVLMSKRCHPSESWDLIMFNSLLGYFFRFPPLLRMTALGSNYNCSISVVKNGKWYYSVIARRREPTKQSISNNFYGLLRATKVAPRNDVG